MAFNAFQLLPRHISTEIMHNSEVFTAKVYSKKTLIKGNNLAELRWDIYLEDLKKKYTKNGSANVKNRK